MMTVAEAFSRTVFALDNCTAAQANESQLSFAAMWKAVLIVLEEELPHGSGFDAASWLDKLGSKPDKLIFKGSYHLMDDTGHYVGWRDFTVTATPSFIHHLELRVNVRYLSKKHADVADLVDESYRESLTREIDYDLIVAEAHKEAKGAQDASPPL